MGLVRCRLLDRQTDAGASAVEFALVVPLLLLILLGVIQYGVGLYQVQVFTSLVSDAAKNAATGISSCSAFTSTVRSMADGSGVDGASVSVRVSWLAQDPSNAYIPSGSATRLGLAKVTATFTPFQLAVPFVPFPSQITRTQSAPVQDLGTQTGPCL